MQLIHQRVVTVLINLQLVQYGLFRPTHAGGDVNHVRGGDVRQLGRIVKRGGGKRESLRGQTAAAVATVEAHVVLLVILQLVETVEGGVGAHLAGVTAVVGLYLHRILVGIAVVVPSYNHVGIVVVVKVMADVVAVYYRTEQTVHSGQVIVVATGKETGAGGNSHEQQR